MAKSIVFRDGLKILGILGDGTGDPTLTRDLTSKVVGAKAPSDASVFLSLNLEEGYILMGNALDIAMPVQVTGAITINADGVSNIVPNFISNFHINSAAGITYSKLNLTGGIVNNDLSNTAAIDRAKLATGTPYSVVINDSTGVMSQTTLTPLRALVSDANGIPTTSLVTNVELGYLDNVTGPIQTQLNNKLSFSSAITPSEGDIVYFNGSTWNRLSRGAVGQVLESTASTIEWGDGTSNGIPSGGTTRQALLKVNNTDFNVDWFTLSPQDIGTTSNASELNILDGATVTTDEVNHLVGVGSPIQTQLNDKLSRSLSFNSMFVGSPDNLAVMLAPGPDFYVLTMIGGTPAWQPAVGGGGGGGDVNGPGSSTDRAIATWNGTGGTSLRNNTPLIDASGNITDVTSLRTVNQGGIILRESTGSGTNAVTLRAATTMGGDYTITFPAATPGVDTFLKHTSGGTYTWDVGGGGGGGLSNSAANTELMMSDGTNAVASGLFATAATGSVTLGSNSITGNRSITAASSSADSGITIAAKANGTIILTTATSVYLASSTNGLQYDTVNNDLTSLNNRTLRLRAHNNTLQLGGGSTTTVNLVSALIAPIAQVSVNTLLDNTHHTVLVNASGGSRTITLPAASTTGKVYRIKKTDATANTVIIDGNASETINGSTTYVLTLQHASVDIQSNGSNWEIVANAGIGGDALKTDFIARETPSGAVNGINVTYTLANTPAGFVHVYLNGLLQDEGGGLDYTRSGGTLTFVTAPATGSKIRVSYIK
jgi:hypothetical protein